MLKSPMSKLVINKIYKLHQKNCHGLYYDKMLEICWNHSLIVSEIALQLATNIQKKYNLNIDFKLIEQGALIHDIGYYICFNNDYQRTVPYIQHGYLGYKLLKKEKFDTDIFDILSYNDSDSSWAGTIIYPEGENICCPYEKGEEEFLLEYPDGKVWKLQ